MKGKKTPQTYVRDVIRRQQHLNDLCGRNTQQAQIRQKRRFNKMTADTKTYSVGDYVWVFQEVVSPKGTKNYSKKWRGQFQITEVQQGGRFYRLSTGRAAHYENIKPNKASSEDWCIPADMQEGDYLIVDPACEVNERGTRDKNDGNEVVDNCNLPLGLELTERVEVEEETLGLTHTENLINKKLKSARETGELETEGENAKKPPFGQFVESYFDLPNHYSNNIVITDGDFIHTERTCAIAITADVSFKTALAAEFKKEYKNIEFFMETEAWCGRDDSTAPLLHHRYQGNICVSCSLRPLISNP